jgi:hypothetical protein
MVDPFSKFLPNPIVLIFPQVVDNDAPQPEDAVGLRLL